MPAPTGTPPARLHLNVGGACNNNCLFCMEDDREERVRLAAAAGAAGVVRMLEWGRGGGEACFTSGEPTLNPHLFAYARLARRLGYGAVSVITNGRRLAHAPYAARLVEAGVDRITISVHGHTARLHDGLTRTPGAFAQVEAALANIAAHRPRVRLSTSTVVNRRNLPHLADLHRFLRGRGVDEVVLNVIQPRGRADRHFDRLVPRYREVAAAFHRALAALAEAAPPLYLLDIPPCTTEGIADRHRGAVERRVYFEASPAADGELRLVDPAGADTAQRLKRAECGRCRHEPACDGVWARYLDRWGWEEFAPVAADSR